MTLDIGKSGSSNVKIRVTFLGDNMLNDVTLKDRDRYLKAVGMVAMNVADCSTKIVRPDVPVGSQAHQKLFENLYREHLLNALLNLCRLLYKCTMGSTIII
jgi:hypothetical protein